MSPRMCESRLFLHTALNTLATASFGMGAAGPAFFDLDLIDSRLIIFIVDLM